LAYADGEIVASELANYPTDSRHIPNRPALIFESVKAPYMKHVEQQLGL